MRKINFAKTKQRLKNSLVALLFAATQVVFPVLASNTAYAAGADIDQWANLDNSWVNGNLNETKASLVEGSSVAFRSKLNGLSNGSHTLRISYDNVSNAKHAYDFLTSYDRTFAPNPCDGFLATCLAGTAGNIPTDTTLANPPGPVTQVPGQIKIFGANGTTTAITAVNYVSTPGHVLSGDKTTVVDVTFTTNTANVVLAWGGHIAKESDWGIGNGASAISGSPYHMRLGTLDGASTGNQDRSMKASAVILLPRITITKIVQGGNALPSDFTFNISPSVNGNSQYSIPVGQSSVTIFDVSPDGNYTITENSAPGYGFVTGSGTNCSFNGSTATATVAKGTAGEVKNASCTFTNGQLPGSIKIVKNTVGGDGTFNFTGNVGVTSLTTVGGTASQTVNNLTPGNYNIAETVPAGWDLNSATCSDGSPISDISLSAGENVTCTFTNTKRGHLIVQKTTLPAGDPTVFSISASGSGTITGGGAGTVSDANDFNYEVTPGTYSVSETVPAGWSKTGDTCQNVVVAAGATAYCLLTNTKLGSITILKDALPNDSQDFLFNVIGLPGGSFSLDDDADATLSNQKVFSDLLPGEYSVTEQSTPGWSLTNLSCNNNVILGATASINLTAGQNVICTFTNTKLGSIAGTKFIVNADGSVAADQTAAMGWTINLILNGNVVDSTQTDAAGNYSFTNLLIGEAYSVAEVLVAGWTQITSTPSCTNDSPIILSAGQNSTGNDFCNFQNGSISGHKWNDINGNGTEDQAEPRLNGWTMTLYKDGNVVTSTVTAGNGDYSFSNLTPGDYSVCETQQAGWVQTYPGNNQCHNITIDQSGESNQANFGNQGRGSIVVVKNVDTDGDGTVDQQDVTNWTWDIDGSGNFATGSGNAQNVAAGSYTVSEDQKDHFHVTASSCTGEQADGQATESLNVSVFAGETVTCTFTNTRDTGTITVNKQVYPSEDDGLFNLQIDGSTAGTGANVGDGGTTGTITVPTGTHSVSEVAGTNTDLDDYLSSFECSNDVSGNGTATGNFTVSTDEDVTCTFTNVRKARITVIKDAQPNDAQDFNFTIDAHTDLQALVSLSQNSFHKAFTLDDDNDATLSNTEVTDGLTPGAYIVHEDATTGWTLDNISCGEGVEFEQEGSDILVWLAPGADVTCTFVNTRDMGTVTVNKVLTPSTDQGKFNLNINGTTYAANIGDGGTTGQVTVPTGDVSVSETAGTNTSLNDYEASYSCVGARGVIVASGTGSSLSLNVAKDQNVVCTFTNNKGEILGATAPLVNTGSNILATTLASLVLIAAVAGLGLATRRRTTTSQ